MFNLHFKKEKIFNIPTIGLILIILIIGYHLQKTIRAKYHLNQLEKELTIEKQKTKTVAVEEVSPLDVFKYINNPKIELIDIRPAKEFKQKHIESSKNIPLNKLKENIADFKKGLLIIIIDSEDSQEGKILVNHFKKEGVHIKYLQGGILNYARQNFPLINDGNPKKTNDLMKVHILSSSEVKKMMLQGKIFSFVDTRMNKFYQLDHIDGSFNIPLEKIEMEKNNLPTHTILLYDNEPQRSFQAGVKLYDMGIFDVYSVNDNYTTFKKILFK